MRRSLFDSLKTLKDHRRAAGRRFSYPAMIEMIVLAGMSGRFGINSISRFIKNNADFFIQRYNFQHGVPSQTGIYNFLKGLDFNQINQVLIQWMKQFINLDDDVWISIDGKVMKSTVQDQHGHNQNYRVLVSAFCSDLGLVIDSDTYDNKRSTETHVAREIINQLEIKGVILTLDALHCQKKLLKPS